MALIALVFDSDAKTADDKQLRSILASSLDRASMRRVLLQGAGQPAASILPNWMSGYGFAFADDADLTRAHPQREPVRAAANWTVRYDANDSLARLLAERVALNARDAGIGLRLMQAGPGLQLVRIPMASANPWVALANVAETLGIALPKSNGDALEDLYAAEQALLASQRVIPLFHLPEEWATSARVKGWRLGAGGSWRLDDVGLGKEMR